LTPLTKAKTSRIKIANIKAIEYALKSPSEDHPLKQRFHFLALRAKRSIDEEELAKVAVRLAVGLAVILAVGVGGFIALFILCLPFIICGNCLEEKTVDAGRPKQKAEASRTKLANNKAVEYV